MLPILPNECRGPYIVSVTARQSRYGRLKAKTCNFIATHLNLLDCRVFGAVLITKNKVVDQAPSIFGHSLSI